MMNLDAVIKIAREFGVPCVILACLLWMLREASMSLHGSVVVPIVQSHTEFLDSTRDTLSEISKTQSQQSKTLQEIAISQTEIRHAVLQSGTKPRVD